MGLPVLNNRKKAITMIVAGLGKPESRERMSREEEDDEYPKSRSVDSEVDAGTAKEAAMEHFLKSVKMDDARGMVDALETFVDLCYSEDEGEESSGVEKEYEYEG